jgi:hypothetical protein
LFRQTGRAIMYPPPQGAEQCERGVSSHTKVLYELGEEFWSTILI